jgi:hypothetical protein
MAHSEYQRDRGEGKSGFMGLHAIDISVIALYMPWA